MKFVYAIRELPIQFTIGKLPDFPRAALQCGAANIFLLYRHAVLLYVCSTYVCVALVMSEYALDRLLPAFYRAASASYKYGLLIA